MSDFERERWLSVAGVYRILAPAGLETGWTGDLWLGPGYYAWTLSFVFVGAALTDPGPRADVAQGEHPVVGLAFHELLVPTLQPGLYRVHIRRNRLGDDALHQRHEQP